MKRLTKLIDEFDKAAQGYGYFSDQGSAEQSENSKKGYDKTKAKLLQEVKKIHNQIKDTTTYLESLIGSRNWNAAAEIPAIEALLKRYIHKLK